MVILRAVFDEIVKETAPKKMACDERPPVI